MDLTHLTDDQLRRICDHAVMAAEPGPFLQIARAMHNARGDAHAHNRAADARRAGIQRALELGVLKPEDIPTA